MKQSKEKVIIQMIAKKTRLENEVKKKEEELIKLKKELSFVRSELCNMKYRISK